MKNKFRPILFSTVMVYAILQGLKTQTRRTVKFKKKINDPTIGFSALTVDGEFEVRGVHENGQYGSSFFNMPIHKGDILWVRETWQHTKILNINPEDDNYGYVYKASEEGVDFANNIEHWTWKPNIFMPKEACRLFLEVIGVRIERLNTISNADCLAEGIKTNTDGTFFDYTSNDSPLQYTFSTPKLSYKSLWDSINGKGNFDNSPFVWVYTFKVIARPLNFK
jgi:hypothetical protein